MIPHAPRRFFLFCFVFCLCACLCAQAAFAAEEEAAEAEPTEVALDDLFMTTVFPGGYTVVTPDTVTEHFGYFDALTPEIAASVLRAEGVYALAFSPEGDAVLRVLSPQPDDTVSVYYDIERYTQAMRTALRNDFLDREAWALTGYRYTEAEWTNKANQGRLLRLVYTIRSEEEIVARGKQAYTVRNGRAYILDLQVTGRRITAEEERTFEAFINGTAFPESTNMPLLPLDLALTTAIPEEVHQGELSIRGKTLAKASVSAWIQASEGEPVEMVREAANASGVFRLDLTLLSEGEYRVYVVASLEGYADSEAGGWVSYDSRRLPVSFTSLPEGLVDANQVLIEGKTLSGVTIQCMEGDVLKKVVTGSGGAFSIKLDRSITGPRTVSLSMTKDGFENRRFDLAFDRQWQMADYIKFITPDVKALSYENLTENAEKFEGRLVKYTGQVLQVSQRGNRTFLQMGLKKRGDGLWTNMIIAIAEGETGVSLAEGDSATVYVAVTTDTYAFPVLTEEGDEVTEDLPAVTLLAYEKNT